jgi:maltose O-acetyltransferase
MIYKLIYKLIASKLPCSNAKWSFGAKKIRYWCAKHIIDFCGKNVNFEKGSRFGQHLSVGNNSGIGVNCEIYGKVTIGMNVLMGPEVIMYTQNHEFRDSKELIINQGYRDSAPIEIDDDVWIGRRVIILPGVHIGKGAVIGAGAVVAKDIPDYSIAVGNPIRIIGKRE